MAHAYGRPGEASLVMVDGDTPNEAFVELNAVDSELVQRCGTLLLLNSRLIELNYILVERFPKRAPQELDTKIRSMREAQYQTVFEERTRVEQDNIRLQTQLSRLKGIEQQLEQVKGEKEQLQELNLSLTQQIESPSDDKYEIVSNQGRSYVRNLENQVESLQLENTRLRNAQESVKEKGNEAIALCAKVDAAHKDAIRDLQTLSRHLEYLETREAQLEEAADQSRVQLNQSQQQVAGLQQQLEILRDGQYAGRMLLDQDAGDLAAQVAKYQEELSVMQVEKLQMEEGLKNQLDHERERVDKYKAKFESSKTHIRELETTVHELQLANAQLEASLQTLQSSLFNGREAQRPNLNEPVRPQPNDSSDEEGGLQDGDGGEAGGDRAGGGRMLWGKRKRVMYQTETKKRMEIEWCFVTTDGVPHSVVLQHTQQEQKTKTRRRLTVDGILKYDDKSSATSFRIEINRDVLVVAIRRGAGRTYQYNLQVNEEDYQMAFQKWKEQRYQPQQ